MTGADAHDSHSNQASQHPAWRTDTFGVLPLDNLKLDVSVLVCVKFAFGMIRVSDGIPITNWNAKHGIAIPLSMDEILWIWEFLHQLK